MGKFERLKCVSCADALVGRKQSNDVNLPCGGELRGGWFQCFDLVHAIKLGKSRVVTEVRGRLVGM